MSKVTIPFKIITRINLLISNYFGDYIYSFQGSSESIRIAVTVSLLFKHNAVTGKQSRQEFSRIFSDCSYIKFNGFEKNGHSCMRDIHASQIVAAIVSSKMLVSMISADH